MQNLNMYFFKMCLCSPKISHPYDINDLEYKNSLNEWSECVYINCNLSKIKGFVQIVEA